MHIVIYNAELLKNCWVFSTLHYGTLLLYKKRLQENNTLKNIYI
jgi:hypothetical protein